MAASPDEEPESPEVSPTPRFFNRELSWLDFNARVLALAQNPSLPVLERAKFLAITGSNLDEFFRVRVAGVLSKLEAGTTTRGPDGRSPRETLEEIRVQTQLLYDAMSTVFHDELDPLLQKEGITYSTMEMLDEDDKEWLDQQFQNRIFPVLTPLALDPAHPFPYISDLSLSLAVFVRHAESGVPDFARVKVPPILPRFVVMPDGERFVPLELVIAEHLSELFPGREIMSHCTFRVTRDADIDISDDADDLLRAVETQLRGRRFGDAVRLEVEDHIADEALAILVQELELTHDDVYRVKGPLDMGGLFALYDLDRPDLKYPAYQPVCPPSIATATATGRSIFSLLRDRDILVHHPYESFEDSVEAMISAAATDPDVLAIKLTMYRTSRESPIVRSLVRAAEAGKQVVVLVELKARFDEEANIEWARVLERAGVHVAYGLVGLKTHSKIALVVRNEGEAIRRYAHIGTGNYNPTTARIYEDLGLFTANHDIGADLTELFNVLTGYSDQRSYRRLVVSPHNTRDTVLELTAAEAATEDGRITLKLNSLVDPDIIRGLYAASQAGTRIEIIVRGICCLVPGVPGLSDNIHVRSIVGRYLEHSRIYRFGNAKSHRTYLIGSADLMQRNLDARVEALVAVEDARLQKRLDQILDLGLRDDALAWELCTDGSWHRVSPDGQLNSQDQLQRLAVQAASRAGSRLRTREQA
jgi:polyphosphate kinase